MTIREVAYARIREEIALSEEVTRSWKQRHNELSLISRLPPELLTTIFKCTIEASEWQHTRFRWFRVTHVCSQWLRISLECPSLWTDIPFRHPRWAEEMLVRSKMAPLNIVVAFGECIGPGHIGARNALVVKTALTQSRIKKLSLTQGEYEGYDSRGAFAELIRLLDSPAPLLETLRISCRSRYGGQNRLPENLFSENAPRLTHLHVSRCGLNWCTPIFISLRSLTVNDTPETIRPPVDQFISALSNMPHLQILEFHADFASTGGAIVPCATTADLPQLVRLSITSHLLNSALLFDHITYPNTARISVTCDIDDSREDLKAHFSLVQRLADNIGRKVEGPIRTLAVRRRGIKVWTSPVIIPRLYSAVLPQFEFRFVPLQMTSDLIIGITMQLLRPLSLRHLESLLVDNVRLQETDWLHHFGGLSRLKKLEVGTQYTGFLGALSSGTSAAPEQSDRVGGPKFKALRKLTIHDWVFDEAHGPSGSDVTCIESLIACLKARCQGGAALSELVLEECRHVDEDNVADLEEIVSRIEWDRETNFTEEEEEESVSAEYYSYD